MDFGEKAYLGFFSNFIAIESKSYPRFEMTPAFLLEKELI